MNLVDQDQLSSEAKRERICKSCRSTRGILDNNPNTNTILLDEYLTNEDRSKVNEILTGLKFKRWDEAIVEGMPIGKFASYEVLLKHKISSKTIPEFALADFKHSLELCLLVYFTSKKVFDSMDFTDVIVYNSLYSFNRTVVKSAELRGIPWFSIHGGKAVNKLLNSLSIFSNNEVNDLEFSVTDQWKIRSKLELSTQQILQVKKNLTSLFAAKSPFIYSTQNTKNTLGEIRSKLSIPSDRKVLLCIMSSADERFAFDMVGGFPISLSVTTTSPFTTSENWILSLLEWVELKDDYHLVVRIHPRELPNKRESVTSQRSYSLIEALDSIAKNSDKISINYPSDDISLYKLALITDIAANSTSTSGAELLLLGIPVVCHDPEQLLAYPREHNYLPTNPTKQDYFSALDCADNDGWNINNSINAFRYRSFLIDDLSLSLDDRVPDRNKVSLVRICVAIRDRYNPPLLGGLISAIRRFERGTKNNGFTNARYFLRVIDEILPNLSHATIESSDNNGSNRREALEIAQAIHSAISNKLAKNEKITPESKTLLNKLNKYISLQTEIKDRNA